MTSERGSSPIELVLGLMVIVVPVAIMVMLVAPVFEARNFARRAAAEGARAGVVASGDPIQSASETVSALATGAGIPLDLVAVEFCDGLPCSWGRGATFVVTVSVQVDEISDLLPIGTMTVSATHAEQLDLYRSRP